MRAKVETLGGKLHVNSFDELAAELD